MHIEMISVVFEVMVECIEKSDAFVYQTCFI